MSIKIHKAANVREPVMIAGWQGMGAVALATVDYLRRKFDATLFAELPLTEFLPPDKIIVEEGFARLPSLPTALFYYKEKPPLLFFESQFQVPGEGGLKVMETLLEVATGCGTTRIYTAAAFPLLRTYREAPTIYGAVNMEHLKEFLVQYGIKPMKSGQISGLNGLLLGYAAKRKIEAICLLATIPFYALNIPNPRAYKALVQVFERILDVEIGIQELDAAIAQMDATMQAVEERGEEAKEEKEERRHVPESVVQKIEKLFEEAKTDKKKAYILKEELDKWGLFKMYEDRFLDLFKSG